MVQMNRQWTLAERPSGPVSEEHFALGEVEVPEIADGQALVKVSHLSMDPTIRGWIQYDTYLPKIEIGEVIRSLGVGEVIASKNESYPVGALVSGITGWQEFAVVDSGARAVQLLPAGTDPERAIALFGPSGLAAYFGLIDVGHPKAGDTVLVSGAAGATGLVVGQIAKELGCRVVGTAGTDEKCQMLVDDYGYDAAINYKADGFRRAVREACPDGVEVFFDNVGGEILEIAIDLLNIHGRIALCGAISTYDTGNARGPANYSALISKRGILQGFLIFDYVKKYGEAMMQLNAWAEAGVVKLPTDVVQGFDQVPAAFQRLFTGGHLGKNMVAL